jgi:hypothetical protein
MHIVRDWMTLPNRTDQTWFTNIICALSYADLHKLSILVQKPADRDEIKTIVFTVSKEPSLFTLNNPIHQRDFQIFLHSILRALEVANQFGTIHVTSAWQSFFNACIQTNFQRRIVHMDLSTEAIRTEANTAEFWLELAARAAPAFLKGIRVRNDAQRWTSVAYLKDMLAATKHLPRLTLTCSETHDEAEACECCNDLLELMCLEGYHGPEHPEVCLENMAVSASMLTALLLQQLNMRKITFKYVKLAGVLPEDPEVYVSPWDDVLHTLAKCGALRELIMDNIYELSGTLGGSCN